MTATINSLTRVFRFAGRDLDDPSPELSPSEVLRHYSRLYPRLLGGKVIDPIVESDKQIYTFKEASYGDKG